MCFRPVLIVVLIFTLFCAACSNTENEVEIPATILPKEKMVQVMVDIHLTEAALNHNFLTNNKVQESKKYNDLFVRNNTNRELYEESLKYYTEHPKLMLVIYEDVLNELSKMQAAVAENKPENPDTNTRTQTPQRGRTSLLNSKIDSLIRLNE